jgi:gamma-glutamyl-gamma-aminobutyrate hydrolase PuuD
MPSQPVIGITAIPRTVHWAQGTYPGQTIGDSFIRAIERAGGIPLILPACDPGAAPVQAALLDGLVLSGGSDVHPDVYDGELHPAMAWIDPRRDAYELALIAAAERRAIPILGVCRGSQILNVARGGTLHAHLDGDLVHETDGTARHPITVEPGSLLAAALPARSVDVTTIHHQGLDRIGADLVVSARAPDGLPEAIEDRGRRVLGVAWHPEVQLDEPAGQPLFDWIVAAATTAGEG